MPLSIISTDYMQLDLLYSFLLSAWTDTRRFRLQIHRYMCFLYSMKKNGSDWHKHGHRGLEWQRWMASCLFFFFFNFYTISKATTYSSPKSHLKKQNKCKNKNKIKRSKQVKMKLKYIEVTAENVHTFVKIQWEESRSGSSIWLAEEVNTIRQKLPLQGSFT